MKVIKIQYCSECPFSEKDGRNFNCKKTLKTTISTKRLPSYCPLENAPSSMKKRISGVVNEDKFRTEVEKVYALYERLCPSLPKINITKMRLSTVKSCLRGIRKCGDDNLETVLKTVEASDFLSGRNGKTSWVADFSWIFRPAMGIEEWNVDKILKGYYTIKTQSNKQSDFVDKKRTYGTWK